MPENPFREHIVIVTGASSGIGKALALQLADQGARLALAARNIDKLNEVAQACRQRDSEAVIIQTDVSDASQCQRLIEQGIAHFGRIDMLVNNAGFSLASRFEDLTDLNHFEQVMAVNFFGMLYCTHAALPHLKKSRGRIVNIASLGGKIAFPFNSSYVASKFAMHGFSDSIRMELAGSGVSVTVIYPYWVISDFHENVLNRHGQRRGRAGRNFYTPRMMTADQCAHRTLSAAWQRRRELVMWPGLPGLICKLVAPGLLDWIIIRFILRPAMKRVGE
jgi:short-subunit dehydrogenase